MSHCVAGVVCENPDDHGDESSGEADAGSGEAESGTDDGTDGAGVLGFGMIEDAEESAAAAIESLATRVESVGEPVELDAFGVEASMNAFAAALVAVGMSVAVIVVGIRNWRQAWRIPARYLRFMLVSLFGVGVALGLWELVTSLSGGTRGRARRDRPRG